MHAKTLPILRLFPLPHILIRSSISTLQYSRLCVCVCVGCRCMCLCMCGCGCVFGTATLLVQVFLSHVSLSLSLAFSLSLSVGLCQLTPPGPCSTGTVTVPGRQVLPWLQCLSVVVAGGGNCCLKVSLRPFAFARALQLHLKSDAGTCAGPADPCRPRRTTRLHRAS